jgi:hypothetical protein
MQVTYTHPTRKLLRLPNHDYSQAGPYFVTICTHDMSCLLGTVRGEHVHLSLSGEIVRRNCSRDVARIARAFPASSLGRIHNHAQPPPRHPSLCRGGACPAQRGWHEERASQSLFLACRNRGIQIDINNQDQSPSQQKCRALLATKLLRTHHSRRRRHEEYPAIYFREPF